MYTLTFGTPTVGTDSATLPFTLDSAVTDGPYEGTASATGGGTTKTGDVTVDANSTTGEIVFTGLSAGTTYTIAHGDIDVTYGGNDQSLSHTGTSFTTASDEPRTATESQWQDLAARVKAKSDVQITMTTTDPGEGSALTANNYVAVYGGDPIIMDYSTTEINTGAKWIDGSVIYKKTINTGTLPNATMAHISHGISGISAIIKFEGWATDGSTSWVPLPLVSSDSSYDVEVAATATEVTLSSAQNRSGYSSSYVTLYYTKSSS